MGSELFQATRARDSSRDGPGIAVVTGGAGFIGSHVVDALLDLGWEVRVIDLFPSVTMALNLANVLAHPNLRYFCSDIRVMPADFPAFEGAEIVLHFAGLGDIVPSVENPRDYMETNVSGTIRVLEAARRAGVGRLVYAASSSCYGDTPPIPTPETAPIRCLYPYALSKNLGEQVAFHWMDVYGLSVNSVRIFNAYGPRARTSGSYGAVFGVFLKQKLEGYPLTVVGDGSQQRDFVFVTDVARAFVLASVSDKSGQIWNLGSGNPKSVNDLVSLLEHPITNIPRRPGEPSVTHADVQKIGADLGWTPQVTFAEGVAHVLEGIENWRGAPLWDEDSIFDATRSWFGLLSQGGKDESENA